MASARKREYGGVAVRSLKCMLVLLVASRGVLQYFSVRIILCFVYCVLVADSMRGLQDASKMRHCENSI
jgi:hypothetical protein